MLVSTILTASGVLLTTLVVAGWFFAIIEAIALDYLSPWVFRVGVRLVNGSVPPQRMSDIINRRPMRIGEAELRWIGDTECVFRKSWGGWFHNPFVLKCHLAGRDSSGTVTCRLALGPLLFFGGIVISSVVPGIALLLSDPPLGLALVLAFWGGLGGLIVWSIRNELKRVHRLIHDIGQFRGDAAA